MSRLARKRLLRHAHQGAEVQTRMNIPEYKQLLDQLIAEYTHIDPATVEGNFNAEVFGNWYRSGGRTMAGERVDPQKTISNASITVRKRLDLFDKKHPGQLPPMPARERLQLTMEEQHIVCGNVVEIGDPEIAENGSHWHSSKQLFYAGDAGLINVKTRYEPDPRFTFGPGSALAFNTRDEAAQVAARLNAENSLSEFRFSAVDWAPG